MMLRYDLARPAEAALLERAVELVLDRGLRTKDLFQADKGQTLLGTKAMGAALTAAVKELA